MSRIRWLQMAGVVLLIAGCELPVTDEPKSAEAGRGGAGSPRPSAKGGGDGAFVEFQPKDGGFKVLMPGQPQVRSQNEPGRAVTMYCVENANGAYSVGVVEVKLPPNTPQEMILEMGCRGAVRSVQGKVTKSKTISLEGKYPGREVSADMGKDGGVFRARFYLVGPRIYQVLVMGYSDWVSSADADKFLDSFALTK